MEQPPPIPLALNNEETRKEFLNHEASVQSIGFLYYIASFAYACLALAMVFSSEHQQLIVRLLMMCVLGLFAWGFFWIGTALRKLNQKVRLPATILACIGLLGIPVGTLINGYILYLLHSAKGKMVFSDEYKEVMQATPEIKYKTSILVWVFFILVVLLILFGVLAAVFSKR